MNHEQETIKMYRVPVVWSMMGYVHVSAYSPEDAMQEAKEKVDKLPLPSNGEYLEDSFEIDAEGDAIEVNVKTDVLTSQLEIDSLLTLSTSHIKPSTREWLNNRLDEDDLVVYEKEEYGWFILVNDLLNYSQLPEDLRDVLNFCQQQKCTWLCLDRDGGECCNLPVYETD